MKSIRSKTVRKTRRGRKPDVGILWRETARLGDLCELYARKLNDRSCKTELRTLKENISEHRARLKKLALQNEDCEGAYQTLVAALRAIARAHLLGQNEPAK